MPNIDQPQVVVTAPHIPKIDLKRHNIRPESDREDFHGENENNNFHSYREDDLEMEIDEEERILSERLPSSLDELTNLCHKLLKEQVQLRKMVEKRETILEQQSPSRISRLGGGQGIMGLKKKPKRQKPKTPTGTRNPTHPRRAMNVAPPNLPFGRRLANRARGRIKLDNHGLPRDYKMTKEEALEILKNATGEDFGLDGDAWFAWFLNQKSTDELEK